MAVHFLAVKDCSWKSLS